MIYSLIPAKVNSSRLPGKNTFEFMLGSKPLICWTIKELNKAEFTPYVFTDEDDFDIGWGIEAKIVVRPESTCQPKSTMKEVVKSFIDMEGLKKNDVILLTYLTCPFRNSEDIKNALMLFGKKKANSLMSVNEVKYRPYGMCKLDGKLRINCLQKQEGIYQQQNTPPLYKANGAIYIFKVSELPKLNNQMFNKDTIGFVLSDVHGIDIDTEEDYLLADNIVRRMQNENLVNQLSGKGRRETEYCTDWTGTNIRFLHTSRA